MATGLATYNANCLVPYSRYRPAIYQNTARSSYAFKSASVRAMGRPSIVEPVHRFAIYKYVRAALFISARPAMRTTRQTNIAYAGRCIALSGYCWHILTSVKIDAGATQIKTTLCLQGNVTGTIKAKYRA